MEPIAQPPNNVYRVPADGSFDISAAPTAPPADAPTNKQLRKMLTAETRQISEWQHKLYADDRYALLLHVITRSR